MNEIDNKLLELHREVKRKEKLQIHLKNLEEALRLKL